MFEKNATGKPIVKVAIKAGLVFAQNDGENPRNTISCVSLQYEPQYIVVLHKEGSNLELEFVQGAQKKRKLDATGKPIVNMNKNRSQNCPVIC